MSGVTDFEAEIAALSGLDLQAVQVRCRKLLRTSLPARLSRSLLHVGVVPFTAAIAVPGGFVKSGGRLQKDQ